MRKRGLPSPDRTAALAYALAHVDLPVVDLEESCRPKHHRRLDDQGLVNLFGTVPENVAGLLKSAARTRHWTKSRQIGAAAEGIMAKFTLSMGFVSSGFYEVLATPPPPPPPPSNPPPTPVRLPGDGFLLREVPLIDPKTNNQVGRLIARVTYMQVSATPTTDPLLYFGNADHHLQKGVISVQGSWRESETNPVFPIIGGTGKYKRARGTVTYDRAIHQFRYDVRR
jgi:hypothetical protein